MKRLLTISSALLALLLGLLPTAASAWEDIYLAGRELSPGLERGDTTYGVLFAGWTLDQAGWAPITESNGGAWTTSIQRVGDAAFGSTVTITGGRWSVSLPAGPTLWGRVLTGTVEWPYDAEEDLGCGAGVALVDANVSLGFPWGRPWKQAGVIEACLDDQEWLEPLDVLRLPPRIWGTMLLN